MAGTKGRSGGYRPNAGRKTKQQESALYNLLKEAWPREQRAAAIRATAKYASYGNISALSILLKYAYVPPASLLQDESKPDNTEPNDTEPVAPDAQSIMPHNKEG